MLATLVAMCKVYKEHEPYANLNNNCQNIVKRIIIGKSFQI